MLAVVVAFSGMSLAQPAKKKDMAGGSDRERLIGAWHLVSMGDSEAGPQPNLAKIQGTLIYTRDGHMSVQLMYPPSAASLSNAYVRNGYEASFGSYDVNEETHTLTHHVKGSITPGLVGEELRRRYRFSGGRLIIQSARPDEHWSVTWEHD
jgi:hypothetical protein